jgi:hypothetical protein
VFFSFGSSIYSDFNIFLKDNISEISTLEGIHHKSITGSAKELMGRKDDELFDMHMVTFTGSPSLTYRIDLSQ